MKHFSLKKQGEMKQIIIIFVHSVPGGGGSLGGALFQKQEDHWSRCSHQRRNVARLSVSVMLRMMKMMKCLSEGAHLDPDH